MDQQLNLSFGPAKRHLFQYNPGIEQFRNLAVPDLFTVKPQWQNPIYTHYPSQVPSDPSVVLQASNPFSYYQKAVDSNVGERNNDRNIPYSMNLPRIEDEGSQPTRDAGSQQPATQQR